MDWNQEAGDFAADEDRESPTMRKRTSMYRWLFLVLPAYAAFAFGRSSWPLAAGFAVAIGAYNVFLGIAERRWADWVRSRAVFLRCVEIGLACIALSLIYLKGRNADLFEFYYDGFYAIPVIFAASAAGRRGLFGSVVAALVAVVFGQILINPEPGLLFGAGATDYWAGLAAYCGIYAVFFATVGGLALFVRDYGSRAQQDVILKLAGSFAGLRDAVVITDPHGRVASMNRAAESMLCCRVHKAFSRPVGELLPGMRFVDDEGRGPDGWEPLGLTARRLDHAEVPCEVTVSAYQVEAETAAYVLVLRDVSGRIRLQRELAQQDRLAALGRVTSGLAHDIENPLSGIQALADVMLMDERPSEEAEALGMIRDEARRLASMLRDVLRFARADQDPRAVVNVNEVVERALKLRSYSRPDRNIRVSRELAVPAPRVLASAAQLEQVILNLLTNGEQAISPGGGDLLVRTRTVADRAIVEVEDSGPGIPDDFIERIFDPFFTTKPSGHGTGLGLSIAREVVERHGGALRVRNTAGNGACFVVELPAAGSEVRGELAPAAHALDAAS